MSHATRPGAAQISLLHAQASHLCRRNATTAASGASQWITGFHAFLSIGSFSPNLVDRRKGRIQWRLLQPWPAGGHLASWPLGQLFTALSGAVWRLVCVVWFFVLKLGQIFLHICNLSEKFNRLNLLLIHRNCLNGFWLGGVPTWQKLTLTRTHTRAQSLAFQLTDYSDSHFCCCVTSN